MSFKPAIFLIKTCQLIYNGKKKLEISDQCWSVTQVNSDQCWSIEEVKFSLSKKSSYKIER